MSTKPPADPALSPAAVPAQAATAAAFDPFADESGGPVFPREEAELAALAHAIRLSAGFKLFFVQHDGPAHRQRLMADLQALLPDCPLHTLHFDAPVDHLLFALRTRLPAPCPPALSLTGLEASIFDPALGPPAPRSSRFLANLNATRNSFPTEVACPLLLWLTEYTLSLLARDAPDFFSIRSGHFRFVEAQRKAVQSLNDIRSRADLLNLAQQREEQGLVAQTQARHQQAEEHFRAALEYVDSLSDPLAAARIQRSRGLNFMALGQVDRATFCFQQALAHLNLAGPSSQPHLTETDALAHGVVFDLDPSLAQRPGAASLRRELLSEVLVALDRLRKDGLGRSDRSLLRVRAVAHAQRGELAQTHDDLALATHELGQALALFEDLARYQPGDVEAQRDLSICLSQLGDAAMARGDWDEAERQYARSLTLVESLAAADPQSARAQRDLSVSLGRLADLAAQRGDWAEAERQYARSLTLAESLASADPRNARAQRDLSVSLGRLGNLAKRRGDWAEAERQLGRSLAIDESQAADDPQNARAQRDLSVSLSRLADVTMQRGDWAEAERQLARSLTIFESLSTADPQNAQAQRDLSISLRRLGQVAMQRGDRIAAKASFDRALQIAQERLAADPQDALAGQLVAEARAGLAMLASGSAPAAATAQPSPVAAEEPMRGLRGPDAEPPPTRSMPTERAALHPVRPLYASLRRLLRAVLSSDSDFDAFVLDMFPRVYRAFSNAMGRPERTSLLLQQVDPQSLLSALREYAPERMRRYESLLRFDR